MKKGNYIVKFAKYQIYNFKQTYLCYQNKSHLTFFSDIFAKSQLNE